MESSTESSDSRFHMELKPLDRKDKPVKQSTFTNGQCICEVDERLEKEF